MLSNRAYSIYRCTYCTLCTWIILKFPRVDIVHFVEHQSLSTWLFILSVKDKWREKKSNTASLYTGKVSFSSTGTVQPRVTHFFSDSCPKNSDMHWLLSATETDKKIVKTFNGKFVLRLRTTAGEGLGGLGEGLNFTLRPDVSSVIQVV